jgi:hypothetical protein
MPPSARRKKLLELLDLHRVGEWQMPPAPEHHSHFFQVSMGNSRPSDFGRRYFYVSETLYILCALGLTLRAVQSIQWHESMSRLQEIYGPETYRRPA